MSRNSSVTKGRQTSCPRDQSGNNISVFLLIQPQGAQGNKDHSRGRRGARLVGKHTHCHGPGATETRAASPVLTRQCEVTGNSTKEAVSHSIQRRTHIATGPTAPTWPFVLEQQNAQVLPHWRLVGKCSLLEECMWQQTRELCAEKHCESQWLPVCSGKGLL